jgi:ankyrin repeat protein
LSAFHELQNETAANRKSVGVSILQALFKGFDNRNELGSQVNDAVGGREWGTPRYFEKLDVLTLILAEFLTPTDENNALSKSIYHIFAENGYATELLICLKHGVDPRTNVSVDNKETPGANALHLAALSGKVNVVQMLLESAGVEVNSVDANKDTAAHYAARGGNIKVLRILNAHNANLISRNINKRLPLTAAIQSSPNNMETINFLQSETNR